MQRLEVGLFHIALESLEAQLRFVGEQRFLYRSKQSVLVKRHLTCALDHTEETALLVDGVALVLGRGFESVGTLPDAVEKVFLVHLMAVAGFKFSGGDMVHRVLVEIFEPVYRMTVLLGKLHGVLSRRAHTGVEIFDGKAHFGGERHGKHIGAFLVPAAAHKRIVYAFFIHAADKNVVDIEIRERGAEI